MNNDPILSRVYVVNPRINFVDEDGYVYIIFENNRKIQKIFRKLGKKIPKVSRLKLDELGSEVFRNIDGQRSIYDIGIIIKELHGDDAEPLYERILTFINYIEVERRFVMLKDPV